jgi:hypothetical protein
MLICATPFMIHALLIVLHLYQPEVKYQAMFTQHASDLAYAQSQASLGLSLLARLAIHLKYCSERILGDRACQYRHNGYAHFTGADHSLVSRANIRRKDKCEKLSD